MSSTDLNIKVTIIIHFHPNVKKKNYIIFFFLNNENLDKFSFGKSVYPSTAKTKKPSKMYIF